MTALACPCCGQPVAEVDPAAISLTLPPIKRRIFDLVHARPGITPESLAVEIYSTTCGGPDDAPKAIRTHVERLNLWLRPYGVRIGRKPPHQSGYRLMRVEPRR